MPRGVFITFEGGEGTGKSTQIRRLEKHLSKAGHDVLMTREPGGTPLAEAIRGVLLDPALAPDGWSELFLFEAARHDLVERVVRQAVESGKVVLCDRFADSSTVYQGAVRGIGVEAVADLNRVATGGLMPDLTVVFDIDPEIGLQRVRERNSATSNSQDRLDTEPIEFHQAVREGFRKLALAEPERVRLVDADGTVDEVFDRLLSHLPRGLR